MFLTNIFDSEIIDHEGEGNWSGRVPPEAGGVHTFIISLQFEVLAK
jgi:hypothetical protein